MAVPLKWRKFAPQDYRACLPDGRQVRATGRYVDDRGTVGDHGELTGSQWIADIGGELLTDYYQDRLRDAKATAQKYADTMTTTDQTRSTDPMNTTFEQYIAAAQTEADRAAERVARATDQCAENFAQGRFPADGFWAEMAVYDALRSLWQRLADAINAGQAPLGALAQVREHATMLLADHVEAHAALSGFACSRAEAQAIGYARFLRATVVPADAAPVASS